PTPERRWGQRRLIPAGRKTALHPFLLEKQSAANHALLAILFEPTPDPPLDSSFSAGLSAGGSHPRHGSPTGRQPSRHQSAYAGGRPRRSRGRDGAPPPTPDGCRQTTRTLQREEESPYG